MAGGPGQGPRLVLPFVQFAACLPAAVPGIADLWRSPDVVGRVRGPADRRKWLAAVVVRSAAAGETMPGPPAQQAAAVGEPATGRGRRARSRKCREDGEARLRTGRFLRGSPARGGERENANSDPCLASHALCSPLCLPGGIA